MIEFATGIVIGVIMGVLLVLTINLIKKTK